MKTDATNFRALSKEELFLKMASLKNELLNMRFKVRMGTLDKPTSIKTAKRQIAQVNTILKEMEKDGRAPVK